MIGASETESCGEICIPMGRENLSLFSPSHNGLCKLSKSYDDDDTANDAADDNDEDNGVPILGRG